MAIFKSLERIRVEMESGCLRDWDSLCQGDEWATVFQGKDWCLHWYEHYVDEYNPWLLAVEREGRLVGVVPMAEGKRDGSFCFAGAGVSDYRDVVAAAGYRPEVWEEYLLECRKRGGKGILSVGPMMPGSESAQVVEGVCRKLSLRLLQREHSAFQFWPEDVTPESDPLKKKSIRYPINYYRRQGTLEAVHIRDRQEWNRIRDDYYRQHSLRQMYGGRVVALSDERKRQFMDRLFDTKIGHATALFVNDRLIAGHFGYEWKGILHWGVPSFDVRERQYSPGLLLVVLTMQKLGEWGLRCMDLTVGEGEMKERFGNRPVSVKTVDIYPSEGVYWRWRIKKDAVGVLKEINSKLFGKEFWGKEVRPRVKVLRAQLDRVREKGIARTARGVIRVCWKKVREKSDAVVYRMSSEDWLKAGVGNSTDEAFEFRENEVYDLLRAETNDREALDEIGLKVREIADLLKTKRTLHTVLIDGKLAGWGISYLPEEPAVLTETGGTTLEFEADSASMYSFYTLPAYRGRKVYQSLLRNILSRRFEAGAKQVYISSLTNNKASRKAIERVGFRAIREDHYLRWFKSEKKWVEAVDGNR